MNSSRRVARNALLNTIKTLLISLFPVITYPYIARKLGVVATGQYTFSASIVSYFFLIAGLGINGYAIREGARLRQNKKELDKFASEIFTINLYSTALSYLLLIAAVLYSAKLRGYAPVIFVLSSEIILNTISLNWVYNVFEDYVFTTNCSIIAQVISLICLFLFVKSENDLIVYAAISVFCRYGYAVVTFFYARRFVKLIPVLKPGKRHIKPVIILFFSMVASTIYISSDVTILGWISGDRSVGLYDAASKTYLTIKLLINAAIAVTVPRMSSLIGNENWKEAGDFGKQVIDALFLLSMPMATGLFMVSKPLIVFYAGSAYYEAYKPLQILCFALCFAVFANFYANCLLMSMRKEKVIMIAMIISAAANIILNFILIPFYGESAAAVTTVAAEIIVFAISFISSDRNLVVRPDYYNMFCVTIGCVGIIICCNVLTHIIDQPLLLLLADMIVSALAYFLIQVIAGNKVVHLIITLIKGRKLVSKD